MLHKKKKLLIAKGRRNSLKRQSAGAIFLFLFFKTVERGKTQQEIKKFFIFLLHF